MRDNAIVISDCLFEPFKFIYGNSEGPQECSFGLKFLSGVGLIYLEETSDKPGFPSYHIFIIKSCQIGYWYQTLKNSALQSSAQKYSNDSEYFEFYVKMCDCKM